jgi:hypothetical protein
MVNIYLQEFFKTTRVILAEKDYYYKNINKIFGYFALPSFNMPSPSYFFIFWLK